MPVVGRDVGADGTLYTLEVLHRYTCPGHLAVYASDPAEAAAVFATREARRAYGRRGFAKRPEPAARPREGETHRFRAWIGKPARGGGEGRVVTVLVTEEPAR